MSLSPERIQKKIDDLLAAREKLIERKNYWEANKLGEQIRGLRDALEAFK
tara:strand:- start:774 stop:923 length:150 start_codon:yes stop_codon:yes gene_type:complete